MTKKRKKKSHRATLDHLSKKAKVDKYPARSVYKLQEIQKKFNILKKGDAVLDLGCCPGSWLLYAADVVGPSGSAVGFDLNPVTVALPPQASAHVADIFDRDLLSFAPQGGWNVVLSDMAPSTTGNKNTDAARSFNLAEAALNLAGQHLCVGGSFVCKIFQGEDFQNFTNMVKNMFKQGKIFKPDACRSDSRETYVVGINKKE